MTYCVFGGRGGRFEIGAVVPTGQIPWGLVRNHGGWGYWMANFRLDIPDIRLSGHKYPRHKFRIPRGEV